MAGTIPYDALPKAYDPPGHVIASTNQPQAGPGHPYYLGTSMCFDPGYRQSVIERFHSGQGALDLKDYTALQNDVTDDLAVRLVPKLLSVLDGTKLTGQQRAARDLLTTWNLSMDTDSAAASMWWTFLDSYLHEVFQPWWDAKKVPASKDRWILDLDRSPIPLREVIEHWTLDGPDNTAFTPPNAAHRDATAAMRTGLRQGGGPAGGQARQQPLRRDLGQAAHSGDPLDHRGRGSRIPALRRRRRPLDRERGGRPAQFELRTELPPRRPLDRAGHGPIGRDLPRRTERHPHRLLVRQPRPAAAGEEVPAAGRPCGGRGDLDPSSRRLT